MPASPRWRERISAPRAACSRRAAAAVRRARRGRGLHVAPLRAAAGGGDAAAAGIPPLPDPGLPVPDPFRPRLRRWRSSSPRASPRCAGQGARSRRSLEVEIGLHLEYCAGWGLSTRPAMAAEPGARRPSPTPAGCSTAAWPATSSTSKWRWRPAPSAMPRSPPSMLADPATPARGQSLPHGSTCMPAPNTRRWRATAAAALDEQFVRPRRRGALPARWPRISPTAARLEAVSGRWAWTRPDSLTSTSRQSGRPPHRRRHVGRRRFLGRRRRCWRAPGSTSSASRCSSTTTAPRPAARAPAAPARTSTTRRESPTGSASRTTCSTTRSGSAPR